MTIELTPVSIGLATLAQVKTQLGISGSAEDTKLTQMLAQASAIIESECGRSFQAADYTEYYNGNGTDQLVLNQYPVNSVTSVHVDDGGYYGTSASPFAASTELTSGEQYALEYKNSCGILRRIGGTWPMRSTRMAGFVANVPADGIGNIKVVYNAGYSTIPADIQFAVVSLTALIRRSASYGQPISAMSLDYFSVTFSGGDGASQLDSAMRAIKKYKEPVL